MEFFPSTLSRTESDKMVDRCQSLIEEKGWGPWAIESKIGQEFLGVVGLHIPSPELPFSPCVEILCRLAFQHRGKVSPRRPPKKRYGWPLKY
jgi:RimJ/RimL family protein N-acetyltransferase